MSQPLERAQGETAGESNVGSRLRYCRLKEKDARGEHRGAEEETVETVEDSSMPLR